MGLQEDFDTLRERFEAYVRRTSVRESKSVNVQLSGSMLSARGLSNGIDGELTRFLFPVPGIIQKMAIRQVGASDKNQKRFSVEKWGSGNVVESRILLLRTESMVFDLGLSVVEGDLLRIFSAELSASDIDLSLYFVPNATQMKRSIDLSLLGDYVDERIRDFASRVSESRSSAVVPKSD